MCNITSGTRNRIQPQLIHDDWPFKNLRLQIFQVYVITKVALRHIPNQNKTARHFKNLRLKIFISPCVISQVVLGYNRNEYTTTGPLRTEDFRFFKSMLYQRLPSDISPTRTRQSGTLRT